MNFIEKDEKCEKSSKIDLKPRYLDINSINSSFKTHESVWWTWSAYNWKGNLPKLKRKNQIKYEKEILFKGNIPINF